MLMPVEWVIDEITRAQAGSGNPSPISLDIAKRLQAIDPTGNRIYIHYPPSAPDIAYAYLPADWKRSEAKQERLQAISAEMHAEYERKQKLTDICRMELQAKFGTSYGELIFNKVMAGELPKVAAKFNLTWIKERVL